MSLSSSMGLEYLQANDLTPAYHTPAVARIGRSNVVKGTLRVTFWGAIAMALTAAIGRAFGIAA